MFSVLSRPFMRFLPRLELADLFAPGATKDQNSLDLEEMSDHWRRDLGLEDVRHRSCHDRGEAFRAAELIFTRRSL